MAGIDMQKLQDLIDQADDFINTIKDLQNKYAKKINGHIENLENTVNDAANHSIEYVKRKMNEILYKIDKVLKAFKKKLQDLLDQIKSWADKQQTQIKLILLKKVQALLGIQLPDAAVEKLSEAIPNFPIPEYEVKLEMPEIDLSNLTNMKNPVSFPRIPMIEVPGYVEDVKKNITDTANNINNTIANAQTALQ